METKVAEGMPTAECSWIAAIIGASPRRKFWTLVVIRRHFDTARLASVREASGTASAVSNLRIGRDYKFENRILRHLNLSSSQVVNHTVVNRSKRIGPRWITANLKPPTISIGWVGLLESNHLIKHISNPHLSTPGTPFDAGSITLVTADGSRLAAIGCRWVVSRLLLATC